MLDTSVATVNDKMQSDSLLLNIKWKCGMKYNKNPMSDLNQKNPI